MHARIARRLAVATATALILVLSACGGGGGDSPAAPPPAQDPDPMPPPAQDPDPMPPPQASAVPPRNQSSSFFYTFDSALTDPAQRQHIRAAVAEAAGNTPNSGSVTQSSTGDGVTTDSVSVSVERDANGMVSWTVREAGGWSVDRASARVLAEPGGESMWKGIEFHQAPGGGEGSGTGPGLYVDVYTDIEAPTQASSCGVGGAVSAGKSCTYEVGGQTFTLRMDGARVCFVFACAGGNINSANATINGVNLTLVTEGSGTSRRIARISENLADNARGGSAELRQDTDYLAGGIWVRVPPDAASVADYEFGAFMDGNDPFRQDNLAGLTGRATYTQRFGAFVVYSHHGMNRNYFADADVRLTADFGDASGLGSISGTVSNFRGEAPASDSYDGVRVSLGTAQIGNADSGFFTGDVTTSGTDSAFTGKWGGQFYGNGAAADDHPGSVAGTFGAATADGRESFVGTYEARR